MNIIFIIKINFILFLVTTRHVVTAAHCVWSNRWIFILSIFLSIYLFIYLSIYISIYVVIWSIRRILILTNKLSILLSIHLSIYVVTAALCVWSNRWIFILSIYVCCNCSPFIYLTIYLTNYLSMYLYIYLSMLLLQPIVYGQIGEF